MLVVNIYMNKLRDLREDKDLTQEALAKYLNCSQSTYSRYENGKCDIPNDVLKKIAFFYSVSTDYILGLTKKRYANIS